MKRGGRLATLFGRTNRTPVDEAGAATEGEEPCIPCGAAEGVRQFSLNPPPLPPVDDAVRPWLTPGSQFAVIDGHVVLYDPVGIVSHVLNPSAAVVWAAVDGHRTVPEIIDVVHLDTGVDRSVLDPDVREVLSRFRWSNIVSFDAPSAAPTGSAGSAGSAGPHRGRDADGRWGAVARRILDGIEWTTVVGPVRASGVDVVVRANGVLTADAIRDALAALPPAGGPDDASDDASGGRAPVTVSVVDAGPDVRRRFRVYVDGRCRWTNTDADHVAHTVMAEITLVATAGTTGFVRLHAGAVERDGVVVAITGASGRGKSTLTAALVQRGFAYVTDELVAVEPGTGAVVPYPKAIDLDVESRRLLGLPAPTGPDRPDVSAPLAVASLGAVSSGGRLGLIVLLDDEPVSRPDEAASPAIRSLLDLVAVTFGDTFADDEALEALADLVGAVPIIRVARGPLDDMGAQVEAALLDAARRAPMA